MDTHAVCAWTNATLAEVDSAAAYSPSVDIVDHSIAVADGAVITARWCSKAGPQPGFSRPLHPRRRHGRRAVELAHRFVARNVEESGAPFLAVDYRLAPEFSGTSLVEDASTALVWLAERALALGVDSDRIVVMGDSAGGGLAAGVAIAARDAGMPPAKQILIYPMRDDRNLTPDPHVTPVASWMYDNNFTGWSALVGDDLGGDQVSPLAAPARLDVFTDLALAYIEVGDLAMSVMSTFATA